MKGLRFAARDFINRQLENDEAFLVQTKMLSGKRIIVSDARYFTGLSVVRHRDWF